jgi:hypothetical protein
MLLLNAAGVCCLTAVFAEDLMSWVLMLCSWASGGALRKIVMTSSSWSLEDEDITTLHEDEVITIVATSETVRPTTRRLTPEDSKPTSLTFTNSTFCPQSVFMCFVWI